MIFQAELWVSMAVFAFVTSVTPGPNNMMLLASGVNFGVRATLPHLLGISCGHFIMLMAVGLGLGELFIRVPVIYQVMQVLGMAYMLYLAWGIVKSGPPPEDEARRDVCSMMHMTGFLGGDYAHSKEWDCFKDGHTGFSPEIQNFRDIFYGYKDELRAERDEARREVCELKSLNFEGKITPKAYAEMRKWDCFNKDSQ